MTEPDDPSPGQPSTGASDGVDAHLARNRLVDLLAMGGSFAPPLTGPELRRRAGRRWASRVDVKVAVTVAAVVVLAVVLVVAVPSATRRDRGTSTATPHGSKTYAAYGLQISVPGSWPLRMFNPCPERAVLGIGSPPDGFIYNCPEFGSGGPYVQMAPADTRGLLSTPQAGSSSFTLHGLHVVSIGPAPTGRGLAHYDWVVHAEGLDVSLSGTGARSRTVLRTLAPATRSATQVPGVASGTVRLGVGVTTVGPSLPLSIRRQGSTSSQSVKTFMGSYSFQSAPGTYVVRVAHPPTGATCTTARVVVRGGLRVTAPAITCADPVSL